MSRSLRVMAASALVAGLALDAGALTPNGFYEAWRDKTVLRGFELVAADVSSSGSALLLENIEILVEGDGLNPCTIWPDSVRIDRATSDAVMLIFSEAGRFECREAMASPDALQIAGTMITEDLVVQITEQDGRLILDSSADSVAFHSDQGDVEVELRGVSSTGLDLPEPGESVQGPSVRIESLRAAVEVFEPITAIGDAAQPAFPEPPGSVVVEIGGVGMDFGVLEQSETKEIAWRRWNKLDYVASVDDFSLNFFNESEVPALEFTLDRTVVRHEQTGSRYDQDLNGTGAALKIAPGGTEMVFEGNEFVLDVQVRFPETPPTDTESGIASFNSRLALRGFGPTEHTWTLLDPDQVLPRRPGELVLQGSGQIPEHILYSLGHQAQPPVIERTRFTLDRLALSAAGALLEGNGVVRWPAADDVPDATPLKPTGELHLLLMGGEGLIAALTEMGVVNPLTASSFTAILALYGVQDDPEQDRYRFRVRMAEDGSVSFEPGD